MNALRSQPEELSRQEMQFKTFEASESTLLPEKEKSSEEKHEDTLSPVYMPSVLVQMFTLETSRILSLDYTKSTFFFFSLRSKRNE